MRYKPYQLISVSVLILAFILAVVLSVYIFSLPASFDSGNIMIANFTIVGLLVWVSSVIMIRKGKAQDAQQFIITILKALIPVVICLCVYWFITVFLAFRNLHY